jgi:hypothetical protein
MFYHLTNTVKIGPRAFGVFNALFLGCNLPVTPALWCLVPVSAFAMAVVGSCARHFAASCDAFRVGNPVIVANRCHAYPY